MCYREQYLTPAFRLAGREKGREGGREGGREREREGGREGGKKSVVVILRRILPHTQSSTKHTWISWHAHKAVFGSF